jgi:hypothetical protein
MICITAFSGVFVLLALLAVVMRVLMSVFPEKAAGVDAATLAAVSAALSVVYPGTKITKVEQLR